MAYVMPLVWGHPPHQFNVYFGRAEQILKQREEIKRKTILERRLRHQTENA